MVQDKVQYIIHYKTKKMKSTLFSLSLRDLLKGLVMAVIVPALVTIQQSLVAGNLIFDWKAIGISALAALIGYLLKNFFTDDVAVAQKTLVQAREKEAEKQSQQPTK